MTISVLGIGWVTKGGYGCVRNGQCQSHEDTEAASALSKRDIFSHPFKNFGRLDALSKSVAYAVALALRDAGIDYSPQHKRHIGIVGTSREGSLRTDVEYFRDYVRSGRTLSRANLFIYTLPSSPLGEAAIHFGFLGPLLYAASGSGSMRPILDMACGMIEGGEADAMLAGAADEDEAVFLALGRAGALPALCAIEQARAALAAPSAIAGMVRHFSPAFFKKGLT
jgi:3-oxoacyl-(acyl-carrier-protein) synthase